MTKPKQRLGPDHSRGDNPTTPAERLQWATDRVLDALRLVAANRHEPAFVTAACARLAEYDEIAAALLRKPFSPEALASFERRQGFKHRRQPGVDTPNSSTRTRP